MATKRTMKDVYRLQKTIASFSDGQASVVDGVDDDNINELTVRITPNSGLYHGGTFDFSVCQVLMQHHDLSIDSGSHKCLRKKNSMFCFKMDLSPYPESSPAVACLTKIYHPNIDCMEEEDNICLNILDSGWTPDTTLEDVVQGFLFLLYNPNLEDPLSPLFDSGMSNEEFVENVGKSLQGETIDNFDFHRNYSLGPKGVDVGEVLVTGNKIGEEETAQTKEDENDSGLGSGSEDEKTDSDAKDGLKNAESNIKYESADSNNIKHESAESNSNADTATGNTACTERTEPAPNGDMGETASSSNIEIEDLKTTSIKGCSNVENTRFCLMLDNQNTGPVTLDIPLIIPNITHLDQVTRTVAPNINGLSELNSQNQGETILDYTGNQGERNTEVNNKVTFSRQTSKVIEPVHQDSMENSTGTEENYNLTGCVLDHKTFPHNHTCDIYVNSKRWHIKTIYEDSLIPEVTLFSSFLPKIVKTLLCCVASRYQKSKEKL